MGRENCVVLALVYVYLELGALVSGAIIYPSVQWSPQNPRFKEGTFRLNVLLLSKINIICPHIGTSLTTTDDANSKSLYENFWIVDNSSYHSCNVNTSITDNRILFKCDKPLQLNFEQLVFQSLGMDNSVVYKKGRTYYFISTSTGSQDSLDNTSNGHCKTDNMKMQIYICNGNQDVHCSKPTTLPAMLGIDGMRITTTAKPSTTRMETTQPISSERPSPTKLKSTQTPWEPEVGYLEKEKEAAVMSVTVWIVIVVMLGAILAVSVGMNFHFWRKQKQSGPKKPPYDRGNSLSPPLMDHV